MQTEQPSPVSRRTLGVFGAVAGAAAILVVLTGIRAREEASARLRDWADDQAIPTVAVALPDARALSATIDLPGRLEAYYRAPIFARVNGYLKGWSADIGAKVRAGQVIAEIEAPDLDQQLLQARADLASQQASAKLSEATLTRRKSLLASNFVSMQEIDERTADLSNKIAAVNASQANVERLEALAGYKKITAPFDIGLAGVDRGDFVGEISRALVDFLHRDKVRGDQGLAARQRDLGQFRARLLIGEVGTCLEQLLVEIGRIDFGNDFAGLDPCADVGVPPFEVAVDARKDRRAIIGLQPAGQIDRRRQRT